MRSWFTALILALALAGSAWGAWQLLDRPVTSFVVKGEITIAQRAALERVLSEAGLEGVLSSDLADVSRAVEALSWTRQVSVRRRWPDGFEIGLSQARPIARWGDAAFISTSGEKLVLPDEYPGLPLFHVALATPQAAMEAYRMLEQVASREGLTIRTLEQSAHGEWTVELADGPTVLLGAEGLNERMHRFLLLKRRVLEEAEAPAVYVDARYASGVAVRFEAPAADPADAPEETALIAQHTTQADKNGG